MFTLKPRTQSCLSQISPVTSSPPRARTKLTTPGLVRFRPESDPASIQIGRPIDETLDVGVAVRAGLKVPVEVYSGTSVLTPGTPTKQTSFIGTLLSPLAASEVGTIRCIGLNYAQHAAEAKLALPTLPTVFMKPATALAGPWPEATVIPKWTVGDDCCDYESELAIVIGKDCKDVSEGEAGGYVLGYTAANDVSSRKSQFEQSQWSFSKGFDGACPIGEWKEEKTFEKVGLIVE